MAIVQRKSASINSETVFSQVAGHCGYFLNDWTNCSRTDRPESPSAAVCFLQLPTAGMPTPASSSLFT